MCKEWDIMMKQAQTCLQYFKEDADTIYTLNYDNGNGMLININLYIICIRDNDAYCHVPLTDSEFNITGTICDKLISGSTYIPKQI